MPVRIVEWKLPYTWGTGIEIDTDKVISLLLREENNLIEVNSDNEIYTDLQLASWLTPSSTFPVWVTVWKVLQADGWTQSWLILNWKTTSWDYARWIYANDGNIYFDGGTGVWKQVYYSSQVDTLISQLNAKIESLMWLWKFLSLWNCITWQPVSFPNAIPYTYHTWDYFLVENIDSSEPATNYRPDGSSYTWTASSVVETDEVRVWDIYIYDGTTWLLNINHGKTLSFANIAWDPYDNTNLWNALDAKMGYTDFNWETPTWATVILDLSTDYTPSNNFTVNAPATVEDWQIYVLRVNNWATAYTMTLGTWIINLQWTDTSLTANATDMFVFLAINWQLELQKELQEPIVYTAWTNITISPTNEISATDTTYGAWTGISIDANNNIQNTWVLSVNWNTWAVTVDEWDVYWPASSTDWHLALFDGATWKLIKDGWAVPTWVPAVWTNWQVLTVVSWAAAWANAPASWIQNDTTWTTTTVTKIRAWTAAEYALITPNATTIYHIY